MASTSSVHTSARAQFFFTRNSSTRIALSRTAAAPAANTMRYMSLPYRSNSRSVANGVSAASDSQKPPFFPRSAYTTSAYAAGYSSAAYSLVSPTVIPSIQGAPGPMNVV